jgi:hypothetical protein
MTSLKRLATCTSDCLLAGLETIAPQDGFTLPAAGAGSAQRPQPHSERVRVFRMGRWDKVQMRHAETG